MRITCVGGGPAGLYFAVLAKLADPAHEVTVLERNPAGVTYGWGVVVLGRPARRPVPLRPGQRPDDLGRGLPSGTSTRCAPPASRRPTSAATGSAWAGGGCSTILAARATELGVDVRYRVDVERPVQFADADLIVACDGAGSRLRRAARRALRRPNVDVGRNKYIWLGTPHVFDTFTFGFERDRGRLDLVPRLPVRRRHQHLHRRVHARRPGRRSGSTSSTRTTAAAVLEEIFARHLDGQPLIDQRAGSAAPAG